MNILINYKYNTMKYKIKYLIEVTDYEYIPLYFSYTDKKYNINKYNIENDEIEIEVTLKNSEVLFDNFFIPITLSNKNYLAFSEEDLINFKNKLLDDNYKYFKKRHSNIYYKTMLESSVNLIKNIIIRNIIE